MQFERDRDARELGATMEQAAEQFGFHIAEHQFGEKHMDWEVSGGEGWGGEFVFDFTFRLENGIDATFQMQIVGVRNMEPEECPCEGECTCDY